MTRTRRCGLVAPHSGLRRLGVLDRSAQLGLGGQRHLGLDLARHRFKTSANLPEVPLTSRPPIKCPIVRMCSSQACKCRIWRHLAVFIAFGKGLAAQRICENADWPAFPAHTTNGEDEYRSACSGGAVVGRRPFWRGFLCRSLRRCRAIQHGLTPGVENFLGKFAISGNAGQHQRSHHGCDHGHRLLARRLARNIRNLRRRACRSSAPAWRRRPCGFSGSRGRFPHPASEWRSHGRDRRDAPASDRTRRSPPARWSGGVCSASLRQRSVERSIAWAKASITSASRESKWA